MYLILVEKKLYASKVVLLDFDGLNFETVVVGHDETVELNKYMDVINTTCINIYKSKIQDAWATYCYNRTNIGQERAQSRLSYHGQLRISILSLQDILDFKKIYRYAKYARRPATHGKQRKQAMVTSNNKKQRWQVATASSNNKLQKQV